MKIYKPVTFEKVKPVSFVRKIVDINGDIVKNLYITDDCKLYDINQLDSCDYIGECPEASIYVRPDDNGRLYANVNPENEKHKCCHLARVAKRAFDDGKYPDEFYKTVQIDHLNPSIPLDNNISNLEWVPRHVNMIRAGETGVMIKKYPKSLSAKVCQMICDGYSRKEIKETLGVNGQFVDDIKSGRSHRSVSSQYLDKGFEYKTYDRTEKDQMAHKVCKLIEEGKRNYEIANELNIKYSFVKDIRAKTTFKKISSNYNF